MPIYKYDGYIICACAFAISVDLILPHQFILYLVAVTHPSHSTLYVYSTFNCYLY